MISLLALVAPVYGCSGLLRGAASEIAEDHAKSAAGTASADGPQADMPSLADRRSDGAATTATYEYGPTPTWKLYTVLGPYRVPRWLYSPPMPPTWQCDMSLGGGAELLRLHNVYPSRSVMASGPLRFGLASGTTPVYTLFPADRDAAAGRGRPEGIYDFGPRTSCVWFLYFEADWTGGKTPPTSYR